MTDCDQLITVVDTTPPVITCPVSVTVECGESTDSAATGTAGASDLCDADPSVSYSDTQAQGTCDGESVITRSWSAKDDCGNESICTQIVTVVDTTAPTLSCPENITLSSTDSTAVGEAGMAVAEDLCSEVGLTYSDEIAGEEECFLVIMRTWTAVDGCGNETNCVQEITIRCAFDFGDAPAGFPTALVNDGARHALSSALRLGAIVDAESDGVSSVDADGDDLADSDDEDGVTIFETVWPIGGTVNATVSVAGGAGGLLQGWIDFNDDGDWDDAGEQVFANESVVGGVNAMLVQVPTNVNPFASALNARFRLSAESNLATTGLASDGEVEDYQFPVTFRQTSSTLDVLVYCDQNDNGEQDAEEFGFEGVTVQLIKDGDVVDEVETDFDGFAAFSPPGTGLFTVRVVDGEGTPLSDMEIAPGSFNPLHFFVADPDSLFSFDFGYNSALSPAYAIDGYVFEDINNDMMMNENLGESGENGVTVRLYQDNVEIDSTVTGPHPTNGLDGYYRFANLDPGLYTVEVELGGILDIFNLYALNNLDDGDGDIQTGPVQSLIPAGNTSVETELFDGCIGTMVSFGFARTPTVVILAGFSGEVLAGGEALLQWETGVEMQNLGFFVYRSDSLGGNFEQVGDFIPAEGSSSGRSYELIDGSISLGSAYYYWLEDVDWSLTRTLHGPVQIQP